MKMRPLGFGVTVGPLVAPNYNNYSTYKMPLLDENFIKDYEDFRNYYYNFIIGRDEQLKVVLGFYIP